MSAVKKPKIALKPFKQSVKMDPHHSDKTWKLLHGAITEIQNCNQSGLSYEEIYRNAYYMVLDKQGDRLYNGVQDTVIAHLDVVAVGVSVTPDDCFLSELNKAWIEHKRAMLMIRDILMYMDKTYVGKHGRPPVYNLGLIAFRDCVARAPLIKGRLSAILHSLILQERSGEIIDRALFKNISHMLVDLGVSSRTVYEEDLEAPFLASSAAFYAGEALDWCASNNCFDYLKKVEARLKEESERVAHYLDSATEPKIRAVVETELIAKHMKTLTEMENSGFVFMLKHDRIQDIKRMYTLFARVVGGLDCLKNLLTAHIKEVGKAIVMDEEKQREQGTYIQQLLDVKDKYDLLEEQAFDKDKQFQKAINSAFEYFINLNPKSPEYISLFIDEKLKKGIKGVSDEEVEVTLDKVMSLFRFIQEKDVFEKYYKQHLAKRLLLGRSVSDDAERNMIAKLKTECGYQFTTKLEGMFTDMRVSVDSMTRFRDYLNDNNYKLPLDLSVNVLTTGFWPTQMVTKCVLPPEIVQCCDLFNKEYLSNHSGRRLTWQTNMGTAELKAQFSRRHLLVVSTYQMVLLLQFNDIKSADNELSCRDIQEATQIPLVDLKRSLATLATGKHRILVKEPQTKTVDETDRFAFNDKFKSKLMRVKIMQIAQKETVEQVSKTRENVDEDRKHQIEACVVRVMKARKSVSHNELISEVTKQLQSRFLPNPLIMKKRIESLIEREYLVRTPEDRKVYKYLA